MPRVALSPGRPARAVLHRRDVATVVNETGARLRQLNQQTQPRIRSRLRELGVKQGWSEADTEVRGLELLQDEELGRLDAQAGDCWPGSTSSATRASRRHPHVPASPTPAPFRPSCWR